MSVADVLVHSVCSGLVDSSLSHSLTNEPVQPETSFLTTQPSEAGGSRQEITEGSIHDCILPFSQTPPTPSTPLQKHDSFLFGGTQPTATTHNADRALSTDLVSVLAPISPGQLSIGSEASADPDMDNLFRLLCDRQDDEAETLLMSQAFWGTEEHLE